MLTQTALVYFVKQWKNAQEKVDEHTIGDHIQRPYPEKLSMEGSDLAHAKVRITDAKTQRRELKEALFCSSSLLTPY